MFIGFSCDDIHKFSIFKELFSFDFDQLTIHREIWNIIVCFPIACIWKSTWCPYNFSSFSFPLLIAMQFP